MNHNWFLKLLTLVLVLSFASASQVLAGKPDPKKFKKVIDAHSKAPKQQQRNFADIASSGALIALGLTPPTGSVGSAVLDVIQSPTPTGDSTLTLIPNVQSETTIAVHGSDVVVGFNDFRGFAVNSVSGYAYSTDGGVTFTDGGQLPNGGGFVSGDPDIKVWEDPGDSTVYFFYSSIFFPPSGDSSLSVNVSTDGGATWSAPREVTSATSAVDFADKEYISVDEETGRLFVSWSNFKVDGTIEMAVSYSDDQGLTWAPKIGIANRTSNKTFDGQGTITRADRNNDNVYIAWRTFGTAGGGVSFARSEDNGVTWSAPIDVVVNVASPEAAYGFDRVNGNPALGVDPFSGEVYLAYVNQQHKPRDADDHGDLWVRRSKNSGKTWSNPRHLGGDPQGRNRTQMFPWISTDPATGSVDVIWYDQRIGTGFSDLTETYHAHSFDQGVSYTCPEPLSETSYQSEFGNNFGAPHQGDYIQSDSIDGLYGSYAAPPRSPAVGDSQIDFEVARGDQGTGTSANIGPISVNGVVGGIVDPGTTLSLIVPLKSNCDFSFDTVDASLSSLSADASVTVADSTYSPLKNSAFSPNLIPFEVDVDSGAALGKYLEFELALDSLETGPGIVRFRLIVGSPVVGAAFLTQDFESVAAPALPAGWAYVNIVGASNPWISVASAGVPGNAAFVTNISTNSFDRLQSPFFALPGAQFYDIEFDTSYDLETATSRTGFDGGSLTLRFNGGGLSIFASAFAVEFDGRYEHRINRSAGGNSGDRSGWSGDSGGYRHIRIRIPGEDVSEADLTSIQFRFDMTSDGAVAETGWFVDNVTIKPVNYVDPTP